MGQLEVEEDEDTQMDNLSPSSSTVKESITASPAHEETLAV